MVKANNRSSKIILALDYADSATALALVKKLDPGDCRLKVGLELFATAGNNFVRDLVDSGFDVFLDLKFHDIPNTVARACRVVADLKVWMTNVHTLGGAAMMLAARNAIDDGPHRPMLIGVTILTSHSEMELEQVGIAAKPVDAVSRLAALAKQAGMDGVVCSAQEASRLRDELGKEFKLVTPGIRPQGSNANDQKRTMTPVQAIAHGSDYLVIGRPVTAAVDPVAALSDLNKSISGDH